MKGLPTLLFIVFSGVTAATEERMEHVLVSVPLHKKTAETALPVTILTGQELRRQAATTIGETLASQPGIASASFGPGVGRPVLRGQQGPRAITLQNGTSSADVSSLSPDHSVAVEALLADSIEVLRGPATLLYGGGAIGGVVNVIDNRIPRTPMEGVEGAIEYRHDQAADMNSGVFRLDGGDGTLAFRLSGASRNFDELNIPGGAIDESVAHIPGESTNPPGFIANTDGDANVYTAGGSYHLGDRGFAGLSVSYLATEYGIPLAATDDAAHEKEAPIRIDLEQTRYDGMLHLHDPVAGVEVLRAFLTYTDYQHRELEGYEVGTRFNRNTFESRVELGHVAVAGLHGVVGLLWREDEFSALGEEAYIPETDSSNVAVFLIEDYHDGAWTYELGARVDWVERNPDTRSAGSEEFVSYSLSGAVLRKLGASWNVGLSLSRSERTPATEELFSNVNAMSPAELVPHAATGVIELGDQNLNEEASLNADLSIDWSGENSWAELVLFYNSFRDYIFLFNTARVSQGIPIYAYEQQDTTFYGIEFESELTVSEPGADEIILKVFGDYVSAEFDHAGDVPRLPPLRLGAELSWSNTTAGAWLRVLTAADQDNPGDSETATDSYTRWDTGVDFQYPLSANTELLLFAKLKNISDAEIRFSTSFLRNYAPEAGRSLELGLRLLF